MTDVLLAYIPFLNPLNFFHDVWYLLLLPLSFGIAVVYKALRLNRFERFWWEVTVMVMQIILAMIGLAIALAILLQIIIPMLPVERM